MKRVFDAKQFFRYSMAKGVLESDVDVEFILFANCGGSWVFTCQGMTVERMNANGFTCDEEWLVDEDQHESFTRTEYMELLDKLEREETEVLYV